MGPDRRLHRVFITRHTEYYLRRDQCVGVRDRRTGQWSREHAALRMYALTVPEQGRGTAWIGERLQFFGRQNDVLTSPVLTVARPAKASVRHYVSLATSGAIRS